MPLLGVAMRPDEYAVWRPPLMVATYCTGPLFRAISLYLDHPNIPSRALQLQLIDLLLPSLLSSYNLPITVQQLLYMGPLNYVSGLVLWLHPSRGLCREICRRAATTTVDKDLRLMTRCGWLIGFDFDVMLFFSQAF